jgi:hypothetical protein
LIDKKDTQLAQALERSSQWRELSKNHFEGRSAAFFCYGDRGGPDLDATGRPKILMHKEWFDPKEEPYDKERNAYQGLVWQCRYSGDEVPDALWSYAEIGSENCTRTRKRTALKTSRQRWRHLTSGRAISRGMWKAREWWKARTMPPVARSPRRNDYENRLMACQAGGGETQP